MILPILLFLMVPFVRAQTKTITFSNSGNNYIVYGDYKSKSADYNPDITICSGTYKFTNGAGNNHPLKILGLPDNTYTVITTQYKNIVLTPGNYDYICTLHSNMNGVIKVEDCSTSGPSVTSAEFRTPTSCNPNNLKKWCQIEIETTNIETNADVYYYADTGNPSVNDIKTNGNYQTIYGSNPYTLWTNEMDMSDTSNIYVVIGNTKRLVTGECVCPSPPIISNVEVKPYQCDENTDEKKCKIFFDVAIPSENEGKGYGDPKVYAITELSGEPAPTSYKDFGDYNDHPDNPRVQVYIKQNGRTNITRSIKSGQTGDYKIYIGGKTDGGMFSPIVSRSACECPTVNKDCNDVIDGTAVEDACGVCDGDGSSCADCEGTPNGNAVVDDCGVCTGGNTGKNHNQDKQGCDQECFSTAVVDCAGECGGNATFSGCDQTCGSTKVRDCLDSCGGTASLDDCGTCTGGGSGLEPNAQKDCDGVCHGTAIVDHCGVCGGDSSSCADCTGTPHGNAVEDECGQCEGDNSTCADCKGVPNGNAVVDDCYVCDGNNANKDQCGVCNGDGYSCVDCTGVLNGDAVVDCAGVCSGDAVIGGCDNVCGSTAVVDCDGVCGGDAVVGGCDNVCGSTAVVDDCGVCGGDGSSCAHDHEYQPCEGKSSGDVCTLCDPDNSDCVETAVVKTCQENPDQPDSLMCDTMQQTEEQTEEQAEADCAGTPNGNAVADDCGVCGGDSSSCADCAGTPNGNAVADDCGVCDGDGSSCADCAGTPNGNAVADDCGVCNGNNSDKDDCGVCNGNNSDKDDCGVCDGDGSSCLDCAGTPNGNAVVDDCGVCGGNDIDKDDCGVCGGDSSSCADCAGTPNGNAVADACGVCNGDGSTCKKPHRLTSTKSNDTLILWIGLSSTLFVLVVGSGVIYKLYCRHGIKKGTNLLKYMDRSAYFKPKKLKF